MQTELNGIRLAYEEEGSGPAVMLIHGFPLCRRMWRPQMAALTAAGYRVVLPDLRGFGESETGGESGSMDLLVDDLIALLDHLGIEKAVVGGMSMGGYVLLNMLARYPRRLAGACFIVTRSDADDDQGRVRRNHLIAEIRAGRAVAVPQAFVPILFAEETAIRQAALMEEVRQWIVATDPAGLVLGLEAIRDRRDSSGLLPTLTRPSLVIGAVGDKAIPVEKSTALAEGIPGAQLSLIAS
ncbi:MAG: alpha/beta fold hydrolase, partial [Desulfuromonadaceae bacterium]